MGRTLKFRYYYLSRLLILTDPPFTRCLVPGIGIIRDEWAWVQDNLHYLAIAADSNDRDEFTPTYIKLITYLRYRNKNPVFKKPFHYPEPQYILTEEKPKLGHYIEWRIGQIICYEIENPKY